jgi:hypothetical protein
MADKRQHLAQMNAVKLADALTDEETKAVIEHQGGRSLLLVEAIHGPYVTGLDGTRTISLLPGTVVRVPDEHSGPVRDLLRSLAVGGAQSLDFSDAGDAFVPPTDDAVAAVRGAADKAAADAADPDAPLPSGAQDGDAGDVTGSQGDGVGEGPWPGDEGYEAPGTEAANTVPAGDDVAAARAKRTRGKAAGE